MKRLLEKYPVPAVLLLVLLCVAPVLALRDFSPANELRYLSIADEALASGHWFSFSNHGIPYADKPPLYFWIVMLCRLLLGKHSMFVLGLFSLLPAFGIVAVMDRWAFRREASLTRAAAAMMLLTTALFLGMSVYVRMDMLMCLWIVLALYQFWKEHSGWFGFFTFLALFTKGPVGLLTPLLAAVAYLIATGRWREIGKRFNGAFWFFLAVPALAWLAGAYWEGGKDYFLNLTVHQTVGRAVHSFHHQAPFWFYGAVIWGVAAPWCLLTVPAVVASFVRRGPAQAYRDPARRTRRERLFAWTVAVTFVMLSCFSGKLALYLLPLLPFLAGVFVRVEKRLGWRPWMRIVLGFVALLFACTGVAAGLGYFIPDRLNLPEGAGDFVPTPWLLPAGSLLLAGGIVALCQVRKGWQRPVLALGSAMLLCVLALTPLLPRVNEVSGYGQLCRDIQAKEVPAGSVWTLGLNRPENMDVYLHREIRRIDAEPEGLAVFLEDPSFLPEGAVVVVSQKQDAAASFRYSDVLEATGRTCTEASGGRYRIWR